MARHGNRETPGPNEPGYKPYRVPEATLSRRVEVRAAATAHEEANRSDPFARRRVEMHMKRGLDMPSDVLSDANARKGTKRAPP